MMLTDEVKEVAMKASKVSVIGMAKDDEAEGEEFAPAESLDKCAEVYDVVLRTGDEEDWSEDEWTFDDIKDAKLFANKVLMLAPPTVVYEAY